MKSSHKFILLTLLTFACSASANAEGLRGKIIGYGTYKAPGQYKRLESPEAPSGAGRSYNEVPTFTATTDRIPAKIGTRFGIAFELTTLPATYDGTLELVQVSKNPPVRRSNGTTSTGFERPLKVEVRSGHAVSWTGYGFDHDYELVPGTWSFEIKYHGKTLCKKDFKVVRD
jgi:hypothetical protein